MKENKKTIISILTEIVALGAFVLGIVMVISSLSKTENIPYVCQEYALNYFNIFFGFMIAISSLMYLLLGGDE